MDEGVQLTPNTFGRKLTKKADYQLQFIFTSPFNNFVEMHKLALNVSPPETSKAQYPIGNQTWLRLVRSRPLTWLLLEMDLKKQTLRPQWQRGLSQWSRYSNASWERRGHGYASGIGRMYIHQQSWCPLYFQRVTEWSKAKESIVKCWV